MKNWKRILAALLALTMLFTLTAFSEEQIAPEAVDEPAPVEELAEAEPIEEQAEDVPAPEEPAEESSEEPAEEPSEEPAEEPTEEPVEEPEAEEPAEAEPGEAPVEESEAGDAETENLNAKNACPEDPDGEHDFWDYDTEEPSDTCANCGYQCTHKKGTYPSYWTDPDYADPINETQHILHFNLMVNNSCNVCGVTLETKIVKSDLTTTQEHDFYDEDEYDIDTCYYCGYDKPVCKHEHTLFYCYPLDDDVTYTKIDEFTHRVVGNLSVDEYCNDCGEYILDEEEGYYPYPGIIEKHDIDYDIGKCHCGFKRSACKHKDCEYYSKYHRSYAVNYGDPKYHYERYEDALRVCNICFDEKLVGTYNLKEEHVFTNGSPICAICGYRPQATKVEIVTPASATLNLGDTLNLSAKVTPDNAVYSLLWTSSNRAVATVSDQGVVTALAAGTTKITVKADNGKAGKVLQITVVDPNVPTTLKFTQKSSEEKLDSKIQLKNYLTVAPATAKLRWSTSSDDVVELDEETGEATMKGIGSAKITVTAATAGGKKAKSASITIKVTDPAAPTKVTLDPSKKITMSTSDESKTIKATLEPAEASKWGVNWKSSNENVAIVNEEGAVTAVGKGKAKITATAKMKNKQGKSVSASVTVEVKNDSFIPTGMVVASEMLNLTTDDHPAEITPLLTPESEKNGSFTWKNDNNYAVKMVPAPDGMSAEITPLAEGTAKITVTSKKNKSVRRVITVNVTDPHAITSFSLKQTGTQELFVGDELPLEPVFGGLNEKSGVIYTAKKNNGIIALEQTGLITALKPGKVQVTATTEKKVPGGKKPKAKSVTLTIRVTDPDSPKEIRIDKNEDQNKFAVGKPVQLSCTIITEKGEEIHTSSECVKWSVKDPKKALIDDEGNLYALKSGVKIIVTVTADKKGADGQAKKATITLQS